MNSFSENPYESPGEQIIRAKLAPPPKQPWPMWAKVTVIVCAIMFGPGALAGLIGVVFFIICAILQRFGVIEPMPN